MTWTKGYFGVQHLTGHRLLENRTYQVSIDIRGSWVEWHILSLHSGHAFTPIREGGCDTPEFAREAAEKAFLAIVGESCP